MRKPQEGSQFSQYYMMAELGLPEISANTPFLYFNSIVARVKGANPYNPDSVIVCFP